MIDLPELKADIEAVTGPWAQAKATAREIALYYENDIDVLAVEQIIKDHSPSRLGDFDAIIEQAENVCGGTDTFTQAQAQKILAGLVLLVARWMR